MTAQVIGELGPILDNVLDTELGIDRAPGVAEGPAGARLVPFDDDEILLPRLWNHGAGGRTRSAVDHQEHRIGAILAADGDPLVQAPDADEAGLVDPVR